MKKSIIAMYEPPYKAEMMAILKAKLNELQNMDEFDEQRRFALDEPKSRYAIFQERTAGYRFFRVGSVVCEPRWSIYARYIHYPSQLEAIEKGEHPMYKRVVKVDFETIQEAYEDQDLDA